jgi:diguanylate cyclase (GGDEF)-like protein/PAS domain S-box-containing protein
MKLVTFILDNIEQILQEWENFARTIFPKNQQLSTTDLRDHAKQMLLVIAKELDDNQLNVELNKNKKKNIFVETAAEIHGAFRLEQGFTVNEITLEYKALRTSVLMLYGKKYPQIQPVFLNDIIRFNEALDQALIEAIDSYTCLKEQQTSLFDTMLSASPDLSYILDLTGSFIYINKAMADLYQQPAHELLGKAKYNFAMPLPMDVLEHIQYILQTGEKCSGEIHVKKNLNTPEYFFEYVYAPVFDKNNKIVAIAGTSRDITKQKSAEAQVWYNANYDYLTGLANRRRLGDKLLEEIKHTKRTKEFFALLFIDLDRFKSINDKFGHEYGDRVLKKIASRISACVRETDVISRAGGDEFILILKHTSQVAQIKTIAQKILSKIKQPIKIKQQMLSLTASIGIAISSNASNDPDVLLKIADQAMYEAKKLGGDQYKFHI